jgi:uncharacterized protein (TIGR02145 family)
MKFLLQVLLMLFFVTIIYAQKTVLKVATTDGKSMTFLVDEIDSITFTPNGSEEGFTCGTSTVKYKDKTYHTVLIGEQCWLKENLNIGLMINTDVAQSDNGIIEKYCFNNSELQCDTLGGFYQWNELMQYTTTEKEKGICPSGWHVPTLGEFAVLNSSVESEGKALMEIGEDFEENLATNSSGFSALLSGYINSNGVSTSSVFVNFYSSSSASSVYFRSNCSVANWTENSSEGYSVRCLKD